MSIRHKTYEATKGLVKLEVPSISREFALMNGFQHGSETHATISKMIEQEFALNRHLIGKIDNVDGRCLYGFFDSCIWDDFQCDEVCLIVDVEMENVRLLPRS